MRQMGTTHSIWEDLLEETSFTLFALHSNLEDYALVYHLNLGCGLHLSRYKEDLELASDVAFPFFHWDDEVNQRQWTLFANRADIQETQQTGGLFSEASAARRHYLIPERKNVDYFLKIEGDVAESQIQESLRSLPQLTTAYALEPDGLKSKLNLIL